MTSEDVSEQRVEPGHRSDQQINQAHTQGMKSTGDPAVDQALASLEGLESRPLAEHHDLLAQVHDQLHGALHAEDESGS